MGYMETLPRPTVTYHNKAYDRISKQHNFSGDGKTILITGGASGLGYHISKAFAEAGVSRIAIVSRSAGQQEEAKKELESAYPRTKILTYVASITDHEKLKEIFLDLGTIDVLVLNATVAHRRAAALDLTEEEVKSAFETNVLASFALAQAFLNLPLPPSGQRTIINLSAAAAHMISPYRAAYGSSKAASVQIMQAFASQYADDDSIKILSFHPGSYYTPGVAANIPANMPGIEWEDEALPAWFCVWLAGTESDFLSGRFLWAHWDVDELLKLKDRLKDDPNFLTIGLIQ